MVAGRPCTCPRRAADMKSLGGLSAARRPRRCHCAFGQGGVGDARRGGGLRNRRTPRRGGETHRAVESSVAPPRPPPPPPRRKPAGAAPAGAVTTMGAVREVPPAAGGWQRPAALRRPVPLAVPTINSSSSSVLQPRADADRGERAAAARRHCWPAGTATPSLTHPTGHLLHYGTTTSALPEPASTPSAWRRLREEYGATEARTSVSRAVRNDSRVAVARGCQRRMSRPRPKASFSHAAAAMVAMPMVTPAGVRQGPTCRSPASDAGAHRLPGDGARPAERMKEVAAAATGRRGHRRAATPNRAATRPPARGRAPRADRRRQDRADAPQEGRSSSRASSRPLIDRAAHDKCGAR